MAVTIYMLYRPFLCTETLVSSCDHQITIQQKFNLIYDINLLFIGGNTLNEMETFTLRIFYRGACSRY